MIAEMVEQMLAAGVAPDLIVRAVRDAEGSRSERPPALAAKAHALTVSDWPADYREQFWGAYPNKVGKADALAKLDRVRKRGDVPFATLMAALDRYVHKTDDRKWCNPATWIHQQRWTDQPAAVAPRRSCDSFASLLADDMRNGNGHRSDDDAPTLDLYARR